jgi:hypothetical protein
MTVKELKALISEAETDGVITDDSIVITNVRYPATTFQVKSRETQVRFWNENDSGFKNGIMIVTYDSSESPHRRIE